MFASFYATRPILRSCVWLLTVFIIAVSGLIWLFSDSELEKWLKKCCFRRNKEQKGYIDFAEEYQAALMVLDTGVE